MSFHVRLVFRTDGIDLISLLHIYSAALIDMESLPSHHWFEYQPLVISYLCPIYLNSLPSVLCLLESLISLLVATLDSALPSLTV